MPFRMPFAGDSEVWSADSILSHVSGALLPMFDTAEATVLRQLCKEFKDAVSEFQWEDKTTMIRGSVAAWRACFPRAKCGFLNPRHFVVPIDLCSTCGSHLHGHFCCAVLTGDSVVVVMCSTCPMCSRRRVKLGSKVWMTAFQTLFDLNMPGCLRAKGFNRDTGRKNP